MEFHDTPTTPVNVATCSATYLATRHGAYEASRDAIVAGAEAATYKHIHAYTHDATVNVTFDSTNDAMQDSIDDATRAACRAAILGGQ